MKVNHLANLLLIISTISSVIISVSSISCYQCESNSELDCAEKFDADTTELLPKPCNHVFEARYCIKSTGMFEGKIGTKRFCSSRDFGDYCDYVRRPGDERDYRSCIFTCSSDDCNHSTHTYVSHFLLITDPKAVPQIDVFLVEYYGVFGQNRTDCQKIYFLIIAFLALSPQ
ncbi:uncharacterized protein LOC128953732 [Oppia nitens]|uniref:uncharacterized protein LOC128953732 n=1 Tax=Oppia nitens TaxID=1686743 RepID=UPI0023D9FB3E|nr:uncharacterized protein LOC128953732 [Oppia nitens]